MTSIPFAVRRRGKTFRAEAGGRDLVLKIAAIAAALVLWQLVAGTLTRSGSVPTPVDVVEALFSLWGTSVYWTAVGATLRAWAAALLICAALGIPLGLLIGSSRFAAASTRWAIDFFRTIPTIALLPLLLLMFGATTRMEVTMIVLAAIWPIVIQSMYSVKEIEPLLKWVTRVFRFSRGDRLRYLWAPSVSLMVSTGLRLAERWPS